MRVSHLSLSNFRNYESAEVSLTPGLNAFIGTNGQGKTNLVEAIHFISGFQSHRVSQDKALIQQDSQNAYVRLQVDISSRKALLELQISSRGANKAQLNKNKVQPRELSHWISDVIFSPEDLQLIKGDPSNRRRFLDTTYALVYPTYRSVLADYEKALKQRNNLLKSLNTSSQSATLNNTLDIWDHQLATYGSHIIFARRASLELLHDPLKSHYWALVQADHTPEMRLVETLLSDVSRETPNLPDHQAMHVSRETIETQLINKLLATRKVDLYRGITTIGPHRDDISLSLNGFPAKGYASHGETWSFALALKLAQANVAQDFSSIGDPVLLLDDVFAELDSHRRLRLLRCIESFEQVIVTSAVGSEVPQFERWHTQYVQNGSISADYPAGTPDLKPKSDVSLINDEK